jgi:hypothetical protein
VTITLEFNAMTTDPVENFIAKLEQHQCNPRGGPDQWTAKCPVPGHGQGRGDRNPSLSVARGENGEALVKCFAGCTPDEIVKALGMTLADLFPPDERDDARVGRNNRASRGQGKARKLYPDADSVVKAFKYGLNRGRDEKDKFGVFDKWTYISEDGKTQLFEVRYQAVRSGEKQYRVFHKVEGGYQTGDPPGLLPLYRLRTLKEKEAAGHERVFVTEGPRCAEQLFLRTGLPVTTSSHGAKSAAKSDWESLAGKKSVVVLLDYDEAGFWYGRDVVRLLAKLNPRPAEVKLLDLPGLADGEDVIEWLDRLPEDWRRDKERVALALQKLADESAEIINLDAVAAEAAIEAAARAARAAGGGRGGERETDEEDDETLLRLASDLELVKTADNRAFVRAPVDRDRGGHFETYEVKSNGFKRWLTHEFFGEIGRPPSADALNAVLGVLDANAYFHGATVTVYTRVAPGADGEIVIDLVDPSWRAVTVTPAGWTVPAIITDPKSDEPRPGKGVWFRRAAGMLGLPVPEPGGTLSDLRRFINVTDDDFPLLLAWLTAALRPCGPYPVLVLMGEQGVAKSTTARVLRSLVDPNVSMLRSEPKEVRDLMISATNSWLPTYENLSSLTVWLSDALCRLATGGGFSTRALYTDNDEMFFDAQRPVILNGIEEFVRRGDLADRSICLTLPKIAEMDRETEEKFKDEFAAAHGRLFGVVLSAVSSGLRLLPEVKVPGKPRMADFAVWGEAVCRSLGWAEGRFLDAYTKNRYEAQVAVLEGSLIVEAMQSFLANSGECKKDEETGDRTWKGSTKDLLDHLDRWKPSRAATARGEGKPDHWPKTAHHLSGHLKRLAPALRLIGVDVDFLKRKMDRRPIKLRLFEVTDPSKATGDDDAPDDADDASMTLPPLGSVILQPESCQGLTDNFGGNDADDALFPISRPGKACQLNESTQKDMPACTKGPDPGDREIFRV